MILNLWSWGWFFFGSYSCFFSGGSKGFLRGFMGFWEFLGVLQGFSKDC